MCLRFLLVIVLLLTGCGVPERQLSQSDTRLAPQLCFARHVIDGSGSGADGVDVGDINQDGYPDVVGGWEESAELKLYLHPGTSVREPNATWKSVDVRGGQSVASIEDAAFADLNADGKLDAIVSATEGEGSSIHNRTIRLHQWDSTRPLDDPESWHGSAIFLDEPGDRFFKVRAAQLDGKNGADIVAASGDLQESVGDSEEITTKGGLFLYTSPPLAQISNTAAWSRKRLADVHKAKSIKLIDMDADQDIDILYSGTKNVLWLENPSDVDAGGEWVSHRIGTASDLALCDVNGDGLQDIVATVSRKDYPVVARWFQGIRDKTKKVRSWQKHDIRIDPGLPFSFYQLEQFSLKSISCGHFRQHANQSGPQDIAITTTGSGYGIFLVVAPEDFAQDYSAPWTAVPITPYRWITKYDNIITVDMDSDGDLDLVTSEENQGWLLQGAGVLWYENQDCES